MKKVKLSDYDVPIQKFPGFNHKFMLIYNHNFDVIVASLINTYLSKDKDLELYEWYYTHGYCERHVILSENDLEPDKQATIDDAIKEMYHITKTLVNEVFSFFPDGCFYTLGKIGSLPIENINGKLTMRAAYYIYIFERKYGEINEDKLKEVANAEHILATTIQNKTKRQKRKHHSVSSQKNNQT